MKMLNLRASKFFLAGLMAISSVGFMASCSDDDDPQPATVEHTITGEVSGLTVVEGLNVVIESKYLAESDTVQTDKNGKYSAGPYTVDESIAKVTYTVTLFEDDDLEGVAEEVDFTKEDIKDGKATKEVDFEFVTAEE